LYVQFIAVEGIGYVYKVVISHTEAVCHLTEIIITNSESTHIRVGPFFRKYHCYHRFLSARLWGPHISSSLTLDLALVKLRCDISWHITLVCFVGNTVTIGGLTFLDLFIRKVSIDFVPLY